MEKSSRSGKYAIIHVDDLTYRRAAKCTKAFKHRGVKVTTKHSYAIDYKYVWECTGCQAEFKRHSKSINPEKQSCGSCRSKLVQTKPEPRKTQESEYQAFVKQNFQKIKKEHEKESLGFIMALVAKQYREQKQMKADVVELLADEMAAVSL
jgi:SprT-like zinc ribbon domain